MRKIFRFIGKGIKWYLKLTLWIWAWIGVSEMAKKVGEGKHGVYSTNVEILDETVEKYKNCFKN